jgi:hypothetical protein
LAGEDHPEPKALDVEGEVLDQTGRSLETRYQRGSELRFVEALDRGEDVFALVLEGVFQEFECIHATSWHTASSAR